MANTFSQVLDKLAEEFRNNKDPMRRLDPMGNVFLYLSLRGIFEKKRIKDDVGLYNEEETVALPLSRPAHTSHQLITKTGFFSLFQDQKLFQTRAGIIIAENRRGQYQGLIKEYVPYDRMYHPE